MVGMGHGVSVDGEESSDMQGVSIMNGQIPYIPEKRDTDTCH